MAFLIVKTSALGDLLHTFPVIEYLHNRFPNIPIDWVVEEGARELIAAHPLIRRTLTINTKKWRTSIASPQTWKEIALFRRTLREVSYTTLFDLQGNTKSALITALAKAHEKIGFAFTSVPEKSNLLATNKTYTISEGQNIRDAYLSLVQTHFCDPHPFTPQGVLLKLTDAEKNFLSTLIGRTRFLIAFGSKWSNKQLSEETLLSFLKLVDAAHAPFFYFLSGNAQEEAFARRLQAHFPSSAVLDNLSLPLLQAVIATMDLVIATDSAPLHLTGTTKTPSFSLFGPSLASVYKPLGSQHTHFQAPCPYGRTFSKRCPILRTCATGACLKEVSAQTLFEAFEVCINIS